LGIWYWRSLGAGSTFIASGNRSAPVNWFKPAAGNFAHRIDYRAGCDFVQDAIL
jgi:hypothetical protein